MNWCWVAFWRRKDNLKDRKVKQELSVESLSLGTRNGDKELAAHWAVSQLCFRLWHQTPLCWNQACPPPENCGQVVYKVHIQNLHNWATKIDCKSLPQSDFMLASFISVMEYMWACGRQTGHPGTQWTYLSSRRVEVWSSVPGWESQGSLVSTVSETGTSRVVRVLPFVVINKLFLVQR